MKIGREKLDPRLAGDVKRYHTEKVLQGQTTAHHCWNVVRLVLVIFPDASRNLILEALFHDLGEGFAGDTPGPAKWASPDLAKAVNDLEEETRLGMVLPWSVVPELILVPQEAAVLSVADLLDAWEHAMTEVSLGNTYMRIVIQRCVPVLAERVKGCPPGTEHRLAKYMSRRELEENHRRHGGDF